MISKQIFLKVWIPILITISCFKKRITSVPSAEAKSLNLPDPLKTAFRFLPYTPESRAAIRGAGLVHRLSQ